jgi:hypothetical protein
VAYVGGVDGVLHLRSRGSSREDVGMSAAAEVYLSVSKPYDVDKVVDVVEKALNDVGFSGATPQTFISGHIWEARGWSVSWDVFEQRWADDFVRAIMAIAPECDVDLYVYNLEREADNVSTSRRLVALAEDPEAR